MSSSTFVQKLNVVTGSAEWCQESDDYDYHQEVARSAYADMLHDHDRNMKYYKGLELAIKELHRRKEKVIVLDIGTGTGLLSMMAAKLGADTIYACEAFSPMAKCAATVIERNGFCDRIKLIPKRSTELEVGEGKDLESRANVLVTEVFDTELIGEGAIGTYNHAHEYLLAEGAFLIPTAATYYALVVDCPLVQGWNKLNPISLPNGVTINFPTDVNDCPGISSVHDLQLSEIKRSEFTQLSEPLLLFKFDFSEHGTRIPMEDTSTVLFRAKENNPCTCIFTWWDLQMSSLVKEGLSSNIITMMPYWEYPLSFGGEVDRAWRDHWMQSLYHIPKPIQLKQSSNYVLQSFHNEYSFWFRITENNKDCQIVEPPTCKCGVHSAMSRSHMGLFNDIDRREKYLKILTPFAQPETVCLVLSDSSSLPFILAGLGVRRVFVLESNAFSKRAMAKLVEHSIFSEQIFILDSLDDKMLAETQVDLVAGEPYFNASVLPWHNLYYWYSLQKLKHLLSPTVKLFPSKAVLKLVVVEFRDLWKIRSPVGKVCNGDFDLVDFDNLIHTSSVISDSVVDAQPLWEYPCVVHSEDITLLTIDLHEGIERHMESTTVKTDGLGHPNGVAIWMEWHHVTADQETVVVSSGLDVSDSKYTKEPLQDDKLTSRSWTRNSKQGVYFFEHSDKASPISTVICNVTFTPENGNMEFSFKPQV